MALYLISIYQPDGPLPPPEDLARILADVEAVDRDIRAAGAWVFAGGLFPANTATVVRARDGQRLITDGPFAEGKEHLGGFTIVDVPDLDVALEWAGRFAEATTLPIEVRPFQDKPEI